MTLLVLAASWLLSGYLSAAFMGYTIYADMYGVDKKYEACDVVFIVIFTLLGPLSILNVIGLSVLRLVKRRPIGLKFR